MFIMYDMFILYDILTVTCWFFVKIAKCLKEYIVYGTSKNELLKFLR